MLCGAAAPVTPQTVTFSNGARQLGGVLYMPEGPGSFPAVLYNHGSAPGMLNNQAFDLLGPLFARRGWVFFAPYRRGQGLSAAAGPFVQDAIAAEHSARMQEALPAMVVLTTLVMWLAGALARKSSRRWVSLATGLAVVVAAALALHQFSLRMRTMAMVRVLQEEQLPDQEAALHWLRHQVSVNPKRIATMGNSYGGIITVLAAERTPYCAAVDAAGGAESWAPALAERMVAAAVHARAPIFFFQAANDHSIAPTQVLAKAMRLAEKDHAAKVYAAYGSSAGEGHSFAWRGSNVWAADVFRFLEPRCP